MTLSNVEPGGRPVAVLDYAHTYEREVLSVVGEWVKVVVLPKADVIPLPIDNTTAERLAEWFSDRVWQSLMHRRAGNVHSLTIEVNEGPDQKASFRRERLPLG